MNESLIQLLHRALRLAREGQRGIACLVVNARGSTPQAAGALMLVDDAANTFGTIGGGCVEAEVRRRALEMVQQGRSGVLTFKLNHDYGWDDGLICGGTIEIAIAPLPNVEAIQQAIEAIESRRDTSLAFEVETEHGPALFTLSLPPRPRLLIAGAGHVGQAVARLALDLEFEVTIYDDRADLLKKLAPPGCTQASGDIAENLASAEIGGDTYCLIVTRGHRHDEQALEAVVGRGAKYIGMIGSRRKVKLIFDDLIERGVDPRDLETVRAPVGLDIGAVTVEEIAVSIAAQLVEVRRAARAKPVSGPHAIERAAMLEIAG
jgi:xanthine dehydrogenase accessory factor